MLHSSRGRFNVQHVLLAASLTACIPTLLHAQSGLWNFSLDTTQSGLNATLDNSTSTAGTLIGVYDPTTNPTGTRTKPGINIFQPFGATENLPVNITLGANLSGNVDSDAAGSFGLDINTATNSVTMSGLTLNLLSDGPASVPVTIALGSPGFRTRNPSFLYPPGNITIPIGSASLVALAANQASPAVGTLTSTGLNTYDFSILTLVNLDIGFDLLGNPFALPGAVAIPLLFSGSLSFNGTSATLLSVQPLDFMQSAQPALTLPEFELPLPTLNPATPANVKLNLALSDIMLGIDGTLTTRANGSLIPAPTSLLALLSAGLLSSRRRRIGG